MRSSLRPPLLALLGVLLAGAGPPARIGDLDELAAKARAEAGAPALGCAVLTQGGEPRIAVAGLRVAGEDDPVTTADAWHWGSITKSMTATLVARLVEKGAVSWDDTVGDLLFEEVPDLNLDLGDATFRHLCSHHGGQPANIPLARFAAFGQHPDDVRAERLAWVRIALAQDEVGPVGEGFLYSNNGYIVAGAMLEAATGEPWEELMQEEVFEPLGIAGAGFGAPPGEAPRGHVPGAEGSDRPAPPDRDNPAALGPAGRVYMPLADMLRYLSAHARRDPDFLAPETWDVLHAPAFGGDYALGWVARGPTNRWHNGSNTMWYAEASFDLETGTVAAVAVNDGDIASVQPEVSELLGKLLSGQDSSGE